MPIGLYWRTTLQFYSSKKTLSSQVKWHFFSNLIKKPDLIDKSNFLFPDQIRPACLPYTATMLRKRTPTTDVLYRLIANGPVQVSQPTSYQLIKYGEVQCQDRVERSVNNTLFCAYTENPIGRNGDPFVALIEDSKHYSVYQISMDVYKTEANPSKFVNIHPYIQWINATISGNGETNNEVVYPLLRANEINKNWVLWIELLPIS